jgi:SAM-dependent methyltransferase
MREMKSHTFRRYLEALRRACPDVMVPGARTLDVGCSVGFMPETARALGYDAYGSEYNPAAAIAAEERLPGRIRAGALEDAAYRHGEFDAVTICDVLEHVPDPLGTLTEIHRILRPGGAVLVVTPDAKCLSARVLGRHWVNVKPEHLWYFTRDQLRDALRERGFRVETMRTASKMTMPDYARRQLVAYPRPLLTPAGRLAGLLPRRLRDVHVPVRVGDMLVVARKR